MRARPATPEDLNHVREIARSYDEVWQWPSLPDYLDHELTHGRLTVAELDGSVVGFGAALERDGATYLADLFIEPEHVGKGAGGAIMATLFPEPGERFTFASSDPRALPLYVRFGMHPFAPLLYLYGDADAAARLQGRAEDLEEVEPADLAEADRRAAGRHRPQDLRFLGEAGAKSFISRGGPGEGYGQIRVGPALFGTAATVGPAGASDPDALARVSRDLLAFAAGLAPQVRISPLGSHPLLEDLVEAGFRMHDHDIHMGSNPGLFDGTRYQPSPVIG